MQPLIINCTYPILWCLLLPRCWNVYFYIWACWLLLDNNWYIWSNSSNYCMITVMLHGSISVLFSLLLRLALTILNSIGLLEADLLSFPHWSVVEDLSTRLECKIRYITNFCVLSFTSCHNRLLKKIVLIVLSTDSNNITLPAARNWCITRHDTFICVLGNSK